ncbi:hypothetical protein SLEP1_g25646 [Rubroshorea leprosula]|uniref:Uncharacterized protein n=1 Tax=Rubroshorea leprosula TaxID=152421 RepID=A0AAV5JVU7_9ROSI|nr:hypothetical protein SLEP1_g25646 [Rubroshorea leprosula]
MEEALLTRSSRSLNQKSSESIGFERHGSSFQAIVDELQSPFSTITFPLVFSTLIAICGSYVFGHAVRIKGQIFLELELIFFVLLISSLNLS